MRTAQASGAEEISMRWNNTTSALPAARVQIQKPASLVLDGSDIELRLHLTSKTVTEKYLRLHSTCSNRCRYLAENEFSL
jgi:hypothetical protein